MTSGSSLTRWWHDAHRFGLTPAKLASRLRHRAGPMIVANSLPKAGSHLLERALCQHPRIYRAPVRTLHRRTLEKGADLRFHVARLRPNQVLLTHLEFTDERVELLHSHLTSNLFMVRDPRDIVVSQAYFIAGRPQHAYFSAFADIPDLRDRMRLVIEGSDEYMSLRSRLESYAGWLSSDNLVVRYEDVIGAAGGGDTERQTAALATIFAYVDLPLTGGEVAALAARTFSTSSPTFRRGTTGQWQQYFDAELHRLYEDHVGDLAAAYGYPVDRVLP